MKYTTPSIFLAAATAVLAIPAPPGDGGNGIPPVATISDPHGPMATTSTVNLSIDPAHTSGPAAPAASGTVQPDIEIPFSDSNALFTLTPADPKAWVSVAAPGVFNATARFSIANQDQASAKFIPPQEFVGLKVYAYQRSDGGLMGLFIDGKGVARLDYFNKTAGPKDPPVLLWEKADLVRGRHVVELKNMVDGRVGKAGQFNIDHVVITAAADAPLTPPAPAKPTDTKPADPKPTDGKPTDTKPADTKPTDTKPTDTKPTDTKPADTKPADTKPADTNSAPASGSETTTTTTSTSSVTPVIPGGPFQDTGFPVNAPANANAAQSQQTPPPNAATAARGVSAAIVAGVAIVASAWFVLV